MSGKNLKEVCLDLTDGWYFNSPSGVIPMKAETEEFSLNFFYWLIPTINNSKLTFIVFIPKEENSKNFFENNKIKLVNLSLIRMLEFLIANRVLVYKSATYKKDVTDFNQAYSEFKKEELCRFSAELDEEQQTKFEEFTNSVKNQMK